MRVAREEDWAAGTPMAVRAWATGAFQVAKAAALDVLKNDELIAAAARKSGLASPLLDACHALFAETVDLGHADGDMVSVPHAIEARTALLRKPG